MIECKIKDIGEIMFYENKINVLQFQSKKEYKKFIFDLENKELTMCLIKEDKVYDYLIINNLFLFGISKQAKLKLYEYFENDIVSNNPSVLLELEDISKKLYSNLIHSNFDVEFDTQIVLKNIFQNLNLKLCEDFTSIESSIKTIVDTLVLLNNKKIVFMYGVFDLIAEEDLQMITDKFYNTDQVVVYVDLSNLNIHKLVEMNTNLITLDEDYTILKSINDYSLNL